MITSRLKMYLFRCAILISYIVTVMSAPKDFKEAISFPELEENPLLVNKQNRTPVFAPSMCPANQLLYPGDQKYDWICDCRSGYLYHPDTDACWSAYRQGPCAKNEYLILPLNKVIPACIENPCEFDTMVPWEGTCKILGTIEPCGYKKFPTEALWINATTLNIECLPIYADYIMSRSNIEEPPIKQNVKCAPGCKRYIENKCTP